MKALLVVVALAMSLAGCYKTSIINGDGGYAAESHDARWYHGFVLGFVDVSGPIDLEQACPTGPWSRIEVKTSILNSVIQWFLFYGIYTPQTVTIYCNGGVVYDSVLNDDGTIVYLRERAK